LERLSIPDVHLELDARHRPDLWAHARDPSPLRHGPSGFLGPRLDELQVVEKSHGDSAYGRPTGPWLSKRSCTRRTTGEGAAPNSSLSLPRRPSYTRSASAMLPSVSSASIS